jgi:hypothetical protein
MIKPDNINPPLLLADDMPIQCKFQGKTDPPRCWERCEQCATGVLTNEEAADFERWLSAHPKATIGVQPVRTMFLCDTHLDVIRGCLPWP